MARIFVSYSRADRTFIDQLIPLIRRMYGNDSLWFDDEIHGGVDWWQMILDEIEKCDLFVYLISNESLESPYCQAELREALRLNKQILPVIIRRLKPPYPGNIADDLAQVLRKTQYVDMTSGFGNANNVTALYAAINRLLNAVPQKPITPIATNPTPEPPVPDKNQENVTLRAAYIAGGFAILAALIAGVFGLWQGVFANQDNIIPEPPPTTVVAQNPTQTPDIVVSTHTPSNAQLVETAYAQQTFAAETQVALDLTATEDGIRSINATSTAVIENTAYAILLALSATPTPSPTITPVPPTATATPTLTPTPDPLLAAFTPVSRNTDWTPVERDFNGVTMVLVPVGCFMMGSESGGADEQPVHEVCFDEPFWIDKYEVTNEQYGSTGCQQWSSEPDQPRNCVDWFDARDHCEARSARLPTEAEWEYAAGGVESWVYPWGNTYNAAVVIGSGDPTYGGNRTAPVGSRPLGASWVGALDMSGNLWEWTSSLYEDYPYGIDHENSTDTNSARVLRGGSFLVTATLLRSAVRIWGNPGYVFNYYGFRCVRFYE